jgi:RND family efflux transporter MFP subunit
VEEADAATKASEEALRTAQFAQKYALKEFQRVESLVKGEVGAVSEDVLEARRHDYDQAVCTERKCGVDLEKVRVAAKVARSKVTDAEIALEEAKLNLSYRTIRAPISGQVVHFSLHVGDFVGAREGQVARLESAERLFVRFDVSQSDIQKVRAGQTVLITSQAFPGHTLRGEVESVNRAADRASGTVRVRVKILEPGDLLPGLFVVGRIVLEERHDVPVLSREAIRYEGKRPYVWYVDGEAKARRRDVTLGLTEDEVVEIRSFGSGEDQPAQIILRGNVKEGKAVAIEPQGAASADPPAP